MTEKISITPDTSEGRLHMLRARGWTYQEARPVRYSGAEPHAQEIVLGFAGRIWFREVVELDAPPEVIDRTLDNLTRVAVAVDQRIEDALTAIIGEDK